MKFIDFSLKVSKIKDLPLPGIASHYKMAALPRILELSNKEIQNKTPKKAGVVILFYPNKEGETQLLLILRKTYKGVHSNQIGFPGGKKEEEDKDLLQTALRETHEEVGVPSKEIKIIKELSQLYIPPSNFMVYPYIGLMEDRYAFKIEEREVESIVEVFLSDLMDDNKIFKEKITTAYSKEWEVPAFKLNGYTVWGATAMMLSEVKELFKQLL